MLLVAFVSLSIFGSVATDWVEVCPIVKAEMWGDDGHGYCVAKVSNPTNKFVFYRELKVRVTFRCWGGKTIGNKSQTFKFKNLLIAPNDVLTTYTKEKSYGTGR